MVRRRKSDQTARANLSDVLNSLSDAEPFRSVKGDDASFTSADDADELSECHVVRSGFECATTSTIGGATRSTFTGVGTIGGCRAGCSTRAALFDTADVDAILLSN
jgi:hypothetical protein